MTTEVVIVGGGPSGLSAALLLGRALRNVLLLDGSNPRNKLAHEAHSFFSRDGVAPLELLSIGRDQLKPYETVKVELNTTVRKIRKVEGQVGFLVTYFGQDQVEQTVQSKALLLATGVTDILPTIPGFADKWAKSIFHCPFCHGFEVKGKTFAFVGNGPFSFIVTQQLVQWSKDVVLITNGPSALSSEQTARLQSIGVKIFEQKVVEYNGNNGQLESIALEDGTLVPRQIAFCHLDVRPKTEDIDLGDLKWQIVNSDPFDIMMKGQTDVPGLYAAGDIAKIMPQISAAVYQGSMVGAIVNHYLAGL